MRKYIFFDIDGTLYNHDNGIGISKTTIETLNKLRDKGHKLFVATGRNLSNALAAIGDIEFDAYVVSDGADVIYKGETISEVVMDDKVVFDILSESRRRNYFTMLLTHNTTYIDDYNDSHIQKYLEKHEDIGLNDKHEIGLENAKGITQKINIVIDESNINDDFSYITDHYNIVTYDDKVFLDISEKKVSKAFGITKLSEVIGFSLEDTIVIGDGDNDIEMFQLANVAIAMGNASEAAKNNSTFVTNNINDEGLTKAFEKLGLI